MQEQDSLRFIKLKLSENTSGYVALSIIEAETAATPDNKHTTLQLTIT